ncbi:hypothetical protein [Celeribacter sp.]|uniref:hypothetical protein n=1 Tax=Celeribacter sp. TaxID=1890673 RepID=UPI003A8E8A4C
MGVDQISKLVERRQTVAGGEEIGMGTVAKRRANGSSAWLSAIRAVTASNRFCVS